MSGSRVEVSTPEGPLEIDLPLPGLYNVYNALAAITAGLRSGVSLEQIRSGLESMRAVFGRVETIEVAGKPVSILLIKNPAGANEVLRTLALEDDAGATGRARASTSGSRSTTASPTGATSRGSGTPTSSCSRTACGASSARAPGRPRWRCA